MEHYCPYVIRRVVKQREVNAHRDDATCSENVIHTQHLKGAFGHFGHSKQSFSSNLSCCFQPCQLRVVSKCLDVFGIK